MGPHLQEQSRSHFDHAAMTMVRPEQKAALQESSDRGMGQNGIGKSKKVFRCVHCCYVTDRRNNLARHVSTMHDPCKQALECCGQRFDSKAVFRLHVRECHKQGYCCAVCGHTFHRKALLKRHSSIHSGRKEFVCSQCTYSTSHKSNLARHMKVHKKTVVLYDNATTSSSSCSDLQQATRKNESNLPLKKRSIRQDDDDIPLDLHVERTWIDPSSPSPAWTATEAPTAATYHCQWKKKDAMSSAREKNRIMALPYKCFECNVRFSSQILLDMHQQAVHPMTDVFAFSVVASLSSGAKRNDRAALCQ